MSGPEDEPAARAGPIQPTARIPLPSFEELRRRAVARLSRSDSGDAGLVGPSSPHVSSHAVPQVALDLAPTPAAATVARAFVVGALAAAADESLGSVAETTLLLVSELVTNAVCHAGSRSRLEVTVGENSVHVDVIDHSFQPPVLQQMQEAREHGLGLVLVDKLADRWGYEFLPVGKRVWFELTF